jgi:hypothetical protein
MTKAIPWEVNTSKFSNAYIAGFLDGDGSIMATVEGRPERRRFPYRIRLRINFTQHKRHQKYIEEIQTFLGGIGTIRESKRDALVELVIQDRKTVELLLKQLLPYIILKERQAQIMLEILDIYKQAIVNTRSSITEKEYLDVLRLVRKIRKLNSRTGAKSKWKYLTP